jgi:hypothetical protein
VGGGSWPATILMLHPLWSGASIPRGRLWGEDLYGIFALTGDAYVERMGMETCIEWSRLNLVQVV